MRFFGPACMVNYTALEFFGSNSILVLTKMPKWYFMTL